MKNYFLILTLLLSSALMTAQTVQPTPNRASEPVQAYPITNTIQNDAFKVWAEDFPNETVGFLHVYADPQVDPKEVYLLRGEEISSTTKALLPKKFQRMANRMNAKLYGAAAIAGMNENMYLLRMDGPLTDRIEMFAIRGSKIKHLKTLAFRKCASGSCAQLDTYITDVDGDSSLDLIQLKRVQTKDGEKTAEPQAYVLDEKRRWRKTNSLDLPIPSLKFYNVNLDDQ